jgi:hypothetical protein
MGRVGQNRLSQRVDDDIVERHTHLTGGVGDVNEVVILKPGCVIVSAYGR